jgi:hypothetical protein
VDVPWPWRLQCRFESRLGVDIYLVWHWCSLYFIIRCGRLVLLVDSGLCYGSTLLYHPFSLESVCEGSRGPDIVQVLMDAQAGSLQLLS